MKIVLIQNFFQKNRTLKKSPTTSSLEKTDLFIIKKGIKSLKISPVFLSNNRTFDAKGRYIRILGRLVLYEYLSEILLVGIKMIYTNNNLEYLKPIDGKIFS